MRIERVTRLEFFCNLSFSGVGHKLLEKLPRIKASLTLKFWCCFTFVAIKAFEGN